MDVREFEGSFKGVFLGSLFLSMPSNVSVRQVLVGLPINSATSL